MNLLTLCASPTNHFGLVSRFLQLSEILIRRPENASWNLIIHSVLLNWKISFYFWELFFYDRHFYELRSLSFASQKNFIYSTPLMKEKQIIILMHSPLWFGQLNSTDLVEIFLIEDIFNDFAMTHFSWNFS